MLRDQSIDFLQGATVYLGAVGEIGVVQCAAILAGQQPEVSNEFEQAEVVRVGSQNLMLRSPA